MRYSAVKLWLKYLNHEPRAGGMVFLLLPALSTSILSFLCVSTIREFIAYQSEGETVLANVLSKRQAAQALAGPLMAQMPLFALGGTNRKQNWIQYEFVDANGKTHRGNGTVALGIWNDLKPGDLVAVRYLRSNSTKSKLECECGLGNLPPLLLFGLLSPCLFAAAIWFGIVGIRRVNQEVRLVRHGVAIPGRVLRVAVEARGTGKRKSYRTVLRYEYTTTGPRRGQVELLGSQDLPWHEDGDIVVLLDPNNRALVTADIFDARVSDRERLFGSSAARG